MTDKELRRLKRSELLEILFYLQKELDELKAENEVLTQRIDELTKSTAEVKTQLSEECRNDLVESIRKVVEDCVTGQRRPQLNGTTKAQNRKKNNGKR